MAGARAKKSWNRQVGARWASADAFGGGTIVMIKGALLTLKHRLVAYAAGVLGNEETTLWDKRLRAI